MLYKWTARCRPIKSNLVFTVETVEAKQTRELSRANIANSLVTEEPLPTNCSVIVTVIGASASRLSTFNTSPAGSLWRSFLHTAELFRYICTHMPFQSFHYFHTLLVVTTLGKREHERVFLYTKCTLMSPAMKLIPKNTKEIILEMDIAIVSAVNASHS